MEAQQCVKLSLTNRSFGLIRPSAQRQEPPGPQDLRDAGPARCGTSRRRAGNASGHSALRHTHQAPAPRRAAPGLPRRPGGHGEGSNTRSHPELGRENPQRRWYCVLRRGRVGRRQVFQEAPTQHNPSPMQPTPGTQANTARKPTRHAANTAQAARKRHRRGVEQPGSSSGS